MYVDPVTLILSMVAFSLSDEWLLSRRSIGILVRIGSILVIGPAPYEQVGIAEFWSVPVQG